MILPITIEHIARYGEIYAAAFSGPPWNDPWKPEDAEVHVREILESKQSYGLEPEFYEKHGFKKEDHVILMGREL